MKSINTVLNKTMFSDFVQLLYPNLCASCDSVLLKNENSICVKCWVEIPRTTHCLDSENPVAKMFWGRVDLKMALSAFQFSKNGKVQRLMHQLKYKGNTKVGELVGVELGKEIIKSVNYSKVDAVIPVPLHPKKMKSRGYNQSVFIAQGVAKVLECEVVGGALIRKIDSGSQTKRSRYERWKNVGEIFELKKGKELEGKHVLIVDDVITTGSTIEGCCLALKSINGISLSIATVAMA